ncbi:IS481 family transposase [Nocardioides aurantiacus]|uniref:IS481 family transposase n=1 Tax=Nocardioides aurantiacus TaxID=86796 RepID=UPI001FE4F63B|nr:IS481 family transposase [Nocardioides aurantiacus]
MDRDPALQARRRDAEVLGDLGQRRIRVPVDPDHVLAELSGERLRHSAHPSSADTHRRRSDVTYPCSRPQIIELRLRERLGPDEIGHRLGVCPRTVTRVIARHHLPRLALLDPITGEQVRASRATTVRYERERPGALVHMDVKKLGRIPDGGGWKAHGRQVGSTRRRRDTVVGFDYVHSLIDDHSRLAYSEILANEQGLTCAGFLERALAYFAAHGIDTVEQLMTDNAWAYRYSLRELCAARGIRQIFIRPHCPWQNGKVERLNRTLLSEWAYRRVFLSNDERSAALAPWLEHYNTQRRHSALGGHPPINRLLPT